MRARAGCSASNMAEHAAVVATTRRRRTHRLRIISKAVRAGGLPATTRIAVAIAGNMVRMGMIVIGGADAAIGTVGGMATGAATMADMAAITTDMDTDNANSTR